MKRWLLQKVSEARKNKCNILIKRLNSLFSRQCLPEEKSIFWPVERQQGGSHSDPWKGAATKRPSLLPLSDVPGWDGGGTEMRAFAEDLKT